MNRDRNKAILMSKISAGMPWIVSIALMAGCGSAVPPDGDATALDSNSTIDSLTGDLSDASVDDSSGEVTDAEVPPDSTEIDIIGMRDRIDPDFWVFRPLPADCTVGRRCEIGFVTPDSYWDNPFLLTPTIRARITGPGGIEYDRYAFWYQDFVDNNGAPGEKKGDGEWRMRFLPTEPGTWTFQLIYSHCLGRTLSTVIEINVSDRDVGHAWPGLVRVSEKDNRYMVFDDGSPYFPVGENMCWWDTDVTDFTGSGENPGWMKKLADNGGNFMRLWMATWGFSLEWTYPEGSILGDYSQRMDRAWALDRVFERADALGLQVMLCMYSHGQFSTVMNSEWNDNPYNTANRGPLLEPHEFFTDQRAQDLTMQRINYIIARWGAEPAIMAWELFNEVDLTDTPEDGAQFAPDVGRWHKGMAGFIKSLDPHDRIVTSSISSFGTFWGLDEAIFRLDDIDFAQVHHYGNELTTFDIVAEVPGVAESYARFDKPVFFAELGVHSAGPVESLEVDPSFIGLHDLIWAPVFAPSAGSGMTWWWDNLIDPNDQYFQFKALADFVTGIDWEDESFVAKTLPAAVADEGSDPELKGFALVGNTTALVWVKNMSEKYWALGDAADPAFIEGATIDLSSLPDGNWTAQWFHTFGYTNYPPLDGTVDNTVTALTVPGFSHDIALRLVRADENPPASFAACTGG